MATEKPALLASPASNLLLDGRFAGRAAFVTLVRDALDCAAREGWPEIILSDATFEDWPLGERVVIESLHAWAKSGRKMTLLANRYDEVLRHHARFVSWRKTWGHILDCRICRVVTPFDFPGAIWSRTWSMHRIDPLRCNGSAGYDRERNVQIREILDEKIRASSPGFPASTLGL